MSKIQFNELNQNASELEVLNAQETTEVVGGHYWGGSSYYYSKYESFSSKFADVYQTNFNDNDQAALGGGKYSSNGNNNGTGQNNNANINQKY